MHEIKGGAWKRRKRKTETEGGNGKRKRKTEISQLSKVNDHYHSVFFAVVKVDSRRCICRGPRGAVGKSIHLAMTFKEQLGKVA